MGALFFIIFCMLLSSSGTAAQSDDSYPCNTAWSWSTEFTLCYTLGIYSQSINLNTIYRNYDSSIRNAFIPDGWSDTDPTGSRACGEGIEEIRTCVRAKYSTCSSALITSLELEVDRYRTRLCTQVDNAWVWSSLAITYFERIATGYTAFTAGSISCVTDVIVTSALSSSSCYAVEIQAYIQFTAVTSFGVAISVSSRFYAAYYSCLWRQLVFSGCQSDWVVGYFSYTALFGLVGTSFSVDQLDNLLTVQDVFGLLRLTLALFGDPHAELEGDMVTCSAVGEHTLLENNYLTITGTNTAVPGSSGDTPPTSLTALTIKFVDATGAEVAVYSASSTLPDTFTNLQSDINGGASGTDVNGASVVSMNGAVRLHFKRAGAVIAIKKVGDGLNIKIRMNPSLYKAATGQLVTGCPGQEVDRSAVTRKRATPSDECVGLSGNYSEACEYDLEMLNDPEVVAETYASLAELDTLVEELDGEIIVEDSDDGGADGSDRVLAGQMTGCLMLAAYVAFVSS